MTETENGIYVIQAGTLGYLASPEVRRNSDYPSNYSERLSEIWFFGSRKEAEKYCRDGWIVQKIEPSKVN